MNLQVLPLAITMMAGPQIMSAIVLLTAPKPVRVSVPFVVGVALATTAGVIVAGATAAALGRDAVLGDPSSRGSVGQVIQYLLVGLLLALSVRSYARRETVEPPAWLGRLQNADPKLALRTGLLVILLMPSDIIIMVTVGFNLAQSGAGLPGALPFVAATVFFAALPLLSYLLFYRRSRRLMPKVRDWMNANSWLVNIVVYVVFVALILSG